MSRPLPTLRRSVVVAALAVMAVAVPTAATAAAPHVVSKPSGVVKASGVTPAWCWAGGIECNRDPK